MATSSLNDPLTPDFWWHNHERMVREGKMDTPFRRNPNDIHEALSLTPEARQPILDAHKASCQMLNINQGQSAVEAGIYTAIARLLDAGVLRLNDESNR